MHIKHLLFDLDDTLYPSSSNMNAGINRRMMECVADFFNCSIEEAKELKKKNIIHQSTTLEWMRSEGFTDIEGFLAKVHPENEADELPEQPGLREFLLSLNIPKSILTNAPHEHADRVLKKLGIADLFECVTDIRDGNFYGKPYERAYRAALKKVGANVSETVFLDDLQKYTDGWNALGGTAILIGPTNGLPLADDAKAMTNKDRSTWGKTIRLPSIYQLPEILGDL